MDIGNYERFLNTSLSSRHNLTAGRIFSNVLKLEREGKYLGQCVQIIPHITDAIKYELRNISRNEKLDVLVVECGGTVGDIESLPFLEALRQIELEDGSSNTCFVHVTLAPVLDAVGEQKTKPTQHSVQELRRIGIQPNILAVRCKTPLTKETIRKISLFASIPTDCVMSSHDAASIYSVPEMLFKQGIVNVISRNLDLKAKPKITKWNKIANSFLDTNGIVKIAIVGKYVDLKDSYVSVVQALLHAGAKFGKEIIIEWIDSERFESKSQTTSAEEFHKSITDQLLQFSGILVPGGFGSRGSEGIINACRSARSNNIPFLGICFGFQLAIVEFARNVCDLKDANSTEIDPATKNPVVLYMPEQVDIKVFGGTMRLGLHDIYLKTDSKASQIYGRKKVQKRHRHRYEFNQEYLNLLEKKGMKFTGSSDEGRRIEVLEIPNHRFYFAIQFHGEFQSRPGLPEPAFESFVKACLG
ncbi:MAG TPA: CTP synthase (glutamine hydrolyzing), partial [Candidatus Nitrosocosmicus sp.]|nr:CTP synthase (glutamine hydrolyzing) [Candidatus Nitrosocosmicus sp.]